MSKLALLIDEIKDECTEFLKDNKRSSDGVELASRILDFIKEYKYEPNKR